MKFEINRDPDYFKKYSIFTNCGSFAFNIQDWYSPDEEYDLDDLELAYELLDVKKMDEVDVIDILFERNVEQILHDFELKVTQDMDYPLKEDEELIAFRMCVNFYDEELVVDYHFRVKRKGQWMEKCGCGPVREIPNYSEESWKISEELIYWGPIAYFIKKCS